MGWLGGNPFILTPSGGGAVGLYEFIPPSGDPTGSTDAGNIVTALGGGFTPILTPGIWNIQAGRVVLGEGQSLIRLGGPFDGVINGVGTGDVIRAFNPSGAGGSYLPGGGKIHPYVINMTGMGSGSSGVHAGDLYNLDVDIYVENAPAGCIAVWFDNQYLFAEQLHGRVWVHASATAVQFDNSANVSGNATGSFDRAILDIMLDQKGAGNCVVFTNGAFIGDGQLGIRGNTDYGGALYYVLTLTGSNAGGFSRIFNSVLNIGVECNGTSGTQPGTINFVTGGSNTILDCTGTINFTADNAFAAAANFGNSFKFDGPAYDLPAGKLQSSGPLGLYRNTGTAGSGNMVNGTEIFTRYEAEIKVFTNANVTGITLQGFTNDDWRVIYVWNKGTGTITFDVAATSHVANGVTCVIQPNAGMSFVWDNDDALWYQIQ